jgi:starvation-inducible DNA-binding protein
MNTVDQLKETFADNYVAAYRAHSIHFNITGEGFYANHKLLQKIYEYGDENTDTLGEMLRALQEVAPETIGEILELADLSDDRADGTDCDTLLQFVLDSQEHMIDSYRKLFEAAEREADLDVSNFAQDAIRAHKKFSWMLRASLEQDD